MIFSYPQRSGVTDLKHIRLTLKLKVVKIINIKVNKTGIGLKNQITFQVSSDVAVGNIKKTCGYKYKLVKFVYAPPLPPKKVTMGQFLNHDYLNIGGLILQTSQMENRIKKSKSNIFGRFSFTTHIILGNPIAT